MYSKTINIVTERLNFEQLRVSIQIMILEVSPAQSLSRTQEINFVFKNWYS
jgi:hypothetical protein